jgi:hypothetical protein
VRANTIRENVRSAGSVGAAHVTAVSRCNEAALMMVILERPFSHFSGQCWLSEVDGELFPESDGPDDPNRSCLILSEEGRDLGPPQSAHQIIANQGGGRFSHWEKRLYFSSGDGSDPNLNGRTYSVRWDRTAYFRRRAAYSVDLLLYWARFLPQGLKSFRDRAAMEIGPGRDMGTILAIAALGASSVWAIDRFKGAWQAGWHEHYLPALMEALPRLGTTYDAKIVETALRAQSLEVGPVKFCDQPLEEIGEFILGNVDVSVSQSTFEHFYSFEDAARVLVRATKPGGIGVHHVDFRDHMNFGEPLEFLLVPDELYLDPEINTNYSRGNRLRPRQMRDALVSAGFQIDGFHPQSFIDPAYLAAFLPRLQHGARSCFSDLNVGDLEVSSAVFILRR